jgi:hypothetical protein
MKLQLGIRFIPKLGGDIGDFEMLPRPAFQQSTIFMDAATRVKAGGNSGRMPTTLNLKRC